MILDSTLHHHERIYQYLYNMGNTTWRLGEVNDRSEFNCCVSSADPG